MGLFWHTHEGPIVKVSYVDVNRPAPPMDAIGLWTRQIGKCSECGDIFEARPVPGRWTVEELNNG